MKVELTIKEIVLIQAALRSYCFQEEKLYRLLEKAGSEGVLAITRENIEIGTDLGWKLERALGFGEDFYSDK